MSEQETFIAHLIELRDRLLHMVVGFLLTFICLFPFANKLYSLLAQPLLSRLPAGGKLIATAVTTPFFVPMKVAMLAAVVLSLPYTLYQAWSFIAPGLYAHERRFVLPLVVTSTLLFLTGMAFAYFLVFPVIFGFIVGTAPAGVAVMTDIGNYLDFVITLFLAFGLAFEVPVVVVVLVRMGIVSVQVLQEVRSYVIVGAFVIGAIFTPPDVVSQIMLAVPLWLLYEAGILAARLMGRNRQAV
ncbi:MAG TPA: twin-arginine translocase subunit TatC [Novimethylophilus sp.]|jgi:sec-independent protein translocase protein TatC|uniref:twin-arginine translocase subunit TatC n=1 Tax=Novimethylophilus sp. TaxID=2137426 RepID=UPI002F4196EE